MEYTKENRNNTYNAFIFSPLQKILYGKIISKEFKPYDNCFDLECIHDVYNRNGELIFKKGQILKNCHAYLKEGENRHKPMLTDWSLQIFKRGGLFDCAVEIANLHWSNYSWNFKLA